MTGTNVNLSIHTAVINNLRGHVNSFNHHVPSNGQITDDKRSMVVELIAGCLAELFHPAFDMPEPADFQHTLTMVYGALLASGCDPDLAWQWSFEIARQVRDKIKNNVAVNEALDTQLRDDIDDEDDDEDDDEEPDTEQVPWRDIQRGDVIVLIKDGNEIHYPVTRVVDYSTIADGPARRFLTHQDRVITIGHGDMEIEVAAD